jgi:hypothetical protein
MMCDEAPAATLGGVNGKQSDRLGIDPADWQAQFLRMRSDQRRCCGNPSWKCQRASSAMAGLHVYSKHVPAQRNQKTLTISECCVFCSALNGSSFMPF